MRLAGVFCRAVFVAVTLAGVGLSLEPVVAAEKDATKAPVVKEPAANESGSKDAALKEAKEAPAYVPLSIFSKALQLVRQDYVDEGKVSYSALITAALKGMLSSLDPHSQFLEPRDYKAIQDDTQSRFSGVGLVLTQKEGRLVVVSVMEGSPGLKAGILPGDQIFKVGGQLTEKMSANEGANLLRGESGDVVRLVIYRPSTKETREIEVQRESIKVTTVRDARLVSGESAGETKIGYVRITQFNTTTAAELSAALDDLEKRGMQALVLDLRGNPGGLLEAAIEVAAQFLPAGSQVVSTEGRVASQSRVYRTPDNVQPRPAYPMAVLANGGSASAAEILAGALKDLRRAIVVGETTFGKGSVQSVIPLQDGAAIRLTTAKYYTPSKQVIHEKGVTPTIRAVLPQEQERLVALQRREEQLDEKEKAEIAGFRDAQLERASDTLKAVVLYSARGGAAEPPQSGAASLRK
jgi:carboxyl-terminal processing protease